MYRDSISRISLTKDDDYRGLLRLQIVYRLQNVDVTGKTRNRHGIRHVKHPPKVIAQSNHLTQAPPALSSEMDSSKSPSPTLDHPVQHGLRLHHFRSHPHGDEAAKDASAEDKAEDGCCYGYRYHLCGRKYGGTRRRTMVLCVVRESDLLGDAKV